MDEDLIDRIHECAFVPDLWSDVLGQLASIPSASLGWMWVVSDDRPRFVGSDERLSKFALLALESGDAFRSQRLARLIAAQHPGFLRGIDIFTEEELEADPSSRNTFTRLASDTERQL